jgi:hypothetical protein
MGDTGTGFEPESSQLQIRRIGYLGVSVIKTVPGYTDNVLTGERCGIAVTLSTAVQEDSRSNVGRILCLLLLTIFVVSLIPSR